MSLTKKYLSNQIYDIQQAYVSIFDIDTMILEVLKGALDTILYEQKTQHITTLDIVNQLDIVCDVFFKHSLLINAPFSFNQINKPEQQLLFDFYPLLDIQNQLLLLSLTDIEKYLSTQVLESIKHNSIPRVDNGFKLDTYSFFANSPALAKKHFADEEHHLYFALNLITNTFYHNLDNSFLFEMIDKQFNDKEKKIMGRCVADNYMATKFDVQRLTLAQRLLHFTPYVSDVFGSHIGYLTEFCSTHNESDYSNQLLDYLLLNLDKKEMRQDIFSFFGLLHSKITMQDTKYIKLIRLSFFHDFNLSDSETIQLFLNKKDLYKDLLVRSFDHFTSTEENNITLYEKAMIELEQFCLSDLLMQKESIKNTKKIKL